MHQRRVLVVFMDVDTQEVHIDWMSLPHAVKQHHHTDVVIYDHGNMGVLHNGHCHSNKKKKVNQSFGDQVTCGGGRRLALLPVLAEVGGGRPAEGVVRRAVGHGQARRAHGHADPVRLVEDGDHAKIGLEFFLQALLGTNQLTVHHQACRGQERRSGRRIGAELQMVNRRFGYLFPGPTPG